MFEELKKTFVPPYSIRDLYSIFISLFIMLAIPLTVLQITSLRDNRSSASTETPGDFKVSINSLKQNEIVSGIVSVGVEAMNSNSSIVLVSLIVDGETVTTTKNQSKSNTMVTIFSWDTTKIHNGVRSVQATATNSLGNKTTSITYRLTVTNNDTQKPSVSFIQPNDGEYISGANHKILLTAEDNLTLENVVLLIDGKEAKSFSTVPFEYNWDTSKVAPGNHVLQASATDTAGNTTSISIEVYKGATTPAN